MAAGGLKAGTVWLEVGTTKNQDGRLFPFDVLPELGDVLQAQRRVTGGGAEAGRCDGYKNGYNRPIVNDSVTAPIAIDSMKPGLN